MKTVFYTSQTIL